MNEIIYRIELYLYSGNLEMVYKEISKLLNNSSEKLSCLSEIEKNKYLEVIQDVNYYSEIGDLLTTVDILKYELVPIFSRREN